MNKIIEKLKKEHQVLLHAFKNIKKIGPDTRISNKIFIAIKNDLMDHIKQEDENIYPVLKKAAENNENLKKTIELFLSEMETLAEKILRFFEKYVDKIPDEKILEEFDIIFVALENRIEKEENVLFEEYIKCINK